jgi:hypothetical protein
MHMSTQPNTIVSRSVAVRVESHSESLLLSLLVWTLIVFLIAVAVGALKPPDPIAATASPSEFSAERAMTHVGVIARTPHPMGSDANNVVKEYLIAKLSGLGLNPQEFPAIGVYQGARNIIFGDTRDVIGRLPGTASSGAIVLMAHYDSVYRAAGAADDGAGVAAILEAIRALRSGPSLKNDLIVLFTDGEEPGLLGAEAFVSSHPWMKDVGLVLNFEARGNSGVSLLFETGINNRSVIAGVAKAAPHPTASSLFYALYKLLPNDTDFTVFRSHKTPGLNFAFGEGLEAYHSRLDTPGNLSAASLQHQGSYALSLTRQFGQTDLTQLETVAGDEIFFNWFGEKLIAYGQGWAVPGESIVTIILMLTVLLSVQKKKITMKRVLLALPAVLAISFVVPAAAAAAGWLVLRLLAKHLIVGDSPANSWLLAGLALVGGSAGVFSLAVVRKRFSVQELSCATLITACALSWVVALVLPAGSYLLFWPLVFVAVGVFAIAVLDVRSNTNALALASIPGTVAAVLLFAPIVYLLYVFLTLQVITVAAMGLLIGVFFLIGTPLLNVAIPREKSRSLALVSLGGAVICIVTGVNQSHTSSQYPQQDNIIYSLDADRRAAAWLSYDHSLDSWTSQFIPDTHQHPQPMPNYLAGSQRPVLSGPASVLDLGPPVAEVKANELVDNLRRIKMNLRSQRNANRIDLGFDRDLRPIGIKIAGREVVPVQNPQGLTVSLFGPFTTGAEIELTFEARSAVAFWLMDRSYGLPEVGTRVRPQNIMASEGSDQTMVCRRYQL